MKYLRLIFRNVVRNRRRTILTVLSITMSLFLISTLKTLLDELESPALTPESAKRLYTRHKVSLGVMMPKKPCSLSGSCRDVLLHTPATPRTCGVSTLTMDHLSFGDERGKTRHNSRRHTDSFATSVR